MENENRKILLESGFSMIELLVVVAVIGILAVTAILNYNSYKRRSFDARAQSDLKNIITAQEASFADSETFISELQDLEGFGIESDGVVVDLEAAADMWSGFSYHPQGSLTFCFNSSNGDGLIQLDGLAQTCP